MSLQKKSAEERLQRGEIPIRIGRRERARDRKAREKKSRIWLPVVRGEKPLTAAEQEEVFARARQVKAEVASGARSAEPVTLADVDVPEAQPEAVDLLASIVLSPLASVRPRFRSPVVRKPDGPAGED
jgi:hypothetical protein